MDKAALKFLGEKIGLDFKYTPEFAAYILHNKLDAFVQELQRRYIESDIPLRHLFKSIAEEQRRALLVASVREMLGLLAANNAEKYIRQSIATWLNNEIPEITKEQIHAHDIALVNYVRSAVLRQFISEYTSDQCVWQHLVDELHRFSVVFDSETFTSYLEVQREEIQKINKELRRREQQLLEAQEIGQVGSFDWDLVGTQTSITPQTHQIFGVGLSGSLTDFLHHVHPDDREKVEHAIQTALITGDYECEYRFVGEQKEKIILARGKVIFGNDRPERMIGTVADVTERHLIIQKLRESEKLYKQAQAIAHIGNWSWSLRDNKVVWSDEMYRIYGLEPQSEEITFERFMSFVHPEDKEDRAAGIKKTLETLYVDEYNFRITAADGVAKILRGKGEVLADHQGKPIALLGTCQDVTGEFALNQQLRDRERYLEELNRSLQRANHELIRTNEELESFNFIASHDLQEPLRKIHVYCNRIVENGMTLLPEPLKDYFQKITNASRRMQKLIEDFLAFSQTFNNVQVPEETDMNKIVEEAKVDLTTRIEEKRAEIIAEQLPQIYAVPFHLKQLMVNLISNALKYMEPQTPPQIVIRGWVVSGMEVPETSANHSMNYVMISVQDNGIGFEPKYRTKIFELFQRLHSKNAYSGTGIGLALCKKIVRNMDGYIIADSEPGKGSTFTFYIPDKRATGRSVA